MEKKSFFEKIVEATGKNFTINESISGYYCLMLDGEPIIDDSACHEVNDDYDTAKEYFADYLLEYEVPNDKKEMHYGVWYLKDDNKKYTVYYNDKVNDAAEVFSAYTLEECKDWINKQLEGMTPVDEEHPCTDDVMYSSKTFYYEVYNRPIVETNGSEIASDWIYYESVYQTDYYYND